METQGNQSSDAALFKKKLKKLSALKGRGTQLISLYVPEKADRSSVMGQLTEEISQSSNIKSPQTRKNVQGALRKIINFLKQIDFKIPKKGIVVFCGNVSEVEGKIDIKLMTIRPIQELKTKLYWCDSSFHMKPLEDMLVPSEIYGLLTMDKREATVAVLKGKKYEVLGHFTSNVAGKIRAGGQSAQRFQRLREESEHEFYKKVSEKMNMILLDYENKLKGIIIGGPGATKIYFLETGLLDHRLKNKIIGKIDLSYTDESGIRELIHKSEDLLRETALMREKKIVEQFFGELSKDGLVVYGRKETEEAIDQGKASQVLVSEELDWVVLKIQCTKCEHTEIKIIEDVDVDYSKQSCSECSGSVEVLEELDYPDYLIEKGDLTGATVTVISTETGEGEQFFRAFGGIGAFLRYK